MKTINNIQRLNLPQHQPQVDCKVIVIYDNIVF